MNPTLIIALLEALPAFLGAVPRVLSLMERFLTWSNSRHLNQWLDEIEGGINQLEKAKTSDDKLAAAHTLVNAIRNIK